MVCPGQKKTATPWRVALGAVLALLAGLAAVATTASANADDEMKALATKSGCLTCHAIESGTPGPNGMAPIGPAWQDVAKHYKGSRARTYS
jgi:cytochrome c